MSDDGTLEDVAAYFERMHEQGRFAGTVLVRGERTARLTLLPEGHSPQSAPIGSVTKLFVAALVGRLVDAGRLRVDTPLADLIGLPREHGALTVGDVLFHRTRFPRDLPRDEDPESCLQAEPTEASGEENYSNCAYEVLAVALERSFDAPFEALMAEWVLEPLQLGSTRFMDATVAPPLIFDGERYVVRSRGVPWSRAAGGLVSTVDDLASFHRGMEDSSFVSVATRSQLPSFAAHAGRLPGYMALVGSHRGLRWYVLSRVDDLPVQDIAADMASLAEGQPLPVRWWRWTAQPTPEGALARCEGIYRLAEVSDDLAIELRRTDIGAVAIIRQGEQADRFHLRFGEDGELHFVAEGDASETMLPFSVVIAEASADCARVPIRLNGGIALTGVRRAE
ncbi:MAG: serine hydrolase domain-containing protein [Myxococcota bacterium]